MRQYKQCLVTALSLLPALAESLLLTMCLTTIIMCQWAAIATNYARMLYYQLFF